MVLVLGRNSFSFDDLRWSEGSLAGWLGRRGVSARCVEHDSTRYDNMIARFSSQINPYSCSCGFAYFTQNEKNPLKIRSATSIACVSEAHNFVSPSVFCA